MGKGKLFLVMAAVVFMGLPCCAWGDQPIPEGKDFGNVKIRHFAAGKKVIPAVFKEGSWSNVDIKLPDIVVENKGKEPITIQYVQAIGITGGKMVASARIQQEELAESMKKNSAAFKGGYLPSQKLSYGDIVIPPGNLAMEGKVEPDESAILLLSRIARLHYAGNSTIETMELAVKIWEGEKSKVLYYPVKLTHYELKGKYMFPLKGDLHLAFLPFSSLHHRPAHSQEFAFDAVGANQKGVEKFTEISVDNPKKLSDYGIWGQDIYAIGDGTVVEMGDKFPESLMSDPAQFNAPGYTEKVLKDLIGKIGFTNAVAGNYIVIDHHNGEFSTYCHIKEGTIKVKEGDPVKKGQVLAQVGNTGNSSAPHLHFQIMDSKDFVTANGLPVMFDNLPFDVMLIDAPVKTNTTPFSDNLFFVIK
jgi:hypothetical protein